MQVIIGLGNPTKNHEADRHNMGFMVLDEYASAHDLSFTEKQAFHALVGEAGGIMLAKPTTWMNDSGLAAQALFRQYHVLPVLVYDDIDIPLGEVKCSYGRGAGGHNGVQSVIAHLGTKDFFRIRVGVRPVHDELKSHILPPDGFQNFLLRPFVTFESDLKTQGIKKAVTIIESLRTKTPQEVMNEVN